MGWIASTIIPDTGSDRTKTDVEMAYPEKVHIDEAIHQKLRKKDLYETDMHKIYNLILGHTNEKLPEKAASDTTFRLVKSVQYPIGYVMILNQLWF